MVLLLIERVVTASMEERLSVQMMIIGLVYHMANIHWGPSGCRYQEVFHLAWSTVPRG